MRMTEYLYMADVESNYIKEFDAVVKGSGPGFVVLDRSAFYPLGGGQPTDKGFLEWGGGKASVTEVRKKGGQHMLDSQAVIPVGTKVHGVIDWERRYGHMKMHTAQHIVSGIVYEEYSARTAGNQIHADRSRIDFAPARFEDEDLRRIEELCNQAFAKNIPVKIYEMERSDLERKVGAERANLDLIPEFIKTLRVIDVEGLDICPCAGTHVRNTSELGSMRITSKDNKGKDRVRIEYVLEQVDP
ncbi:MAG: alanyl-tRNA editing protein [Candidatus Thermoplasmatota archaeon]|nr:alanyl-tRNA editing protein [Candidatus Thermoplasmatota archaeon]